MSYIDIIGNESITDEGRKILEKKDLECKTIDRLRMEIKELNNDIPKIIQGNFSSTTRNILLLIRERKEERLNDILENGLK